LGAERENNTGEVYPAGDRSNCNRRLRVGNLLFSSDLRRPAQTPCCAFQRIVWSVDGEYLSRAARRWDGRASALDSTSQAYSALCLHRGFRRHYDRRSLESLCEHRFSAGVALGLSVDVAGLQPLGRGMDAVIAPQQVKDLFGAGQLISQIAQRSIVILLRYSQRVRSKCLGIVG
jgi:hypothetical protein